MILQHTNFNTTNEVKRKQEINSKTNTESAKQKFHVIIQRNHHLLDSTTIFFRKRIYILSIQHFRSVSNYTIICSSSTTLFQFTTTPNNTSNNHKSNTDNQTDISVNIENSDNINNRTCNRTNINLRAIIDSKINCPANRSITTDNFITINTITNNSITSDNFIFNSDKLKLI